MKKIGLLALLCIAFVQLRAQDAVAFKIKYMPGRQYQMSMKMNMKVLGTVSGDSTLINKLKESGITQPVNVNVNLGMTGNITTGTMGSDGSFPFTTIYKFENLDVMLGDKQIPIPPKVTETTLKSAGHITADGILHIDSVAGKKANDSTKRKMEQTMNMFQRQIQFPEKAMKPGESFTQNTPINIPMGGKTAGDMKMNYDITYKLNSIDGGKAYFDITPNLSMNLDIPGKVTVNMTGTGSGKMVYSIKDNFPVSHDGEFKMNIKADAGKVNVDGTADITANSTITIN
ncbi:MAG TPA: hypothetical protein VHC47_10420 [Mucilaginibacter sp.]|nr:hypothetical protein [Mucilaginibacter sp.]